MSDRYEGMSYAELWEMYRRDRAILTSEESHELWAATVRARDREAAPPPADHEQRMRRLRGTTFDDPGWAPQVIAHGFPRQPQDRVRVITADGRQRVLVVRGAHRGPASGFQYYQLQSPDDPELSWYLARDDGEPSWDKGLEVDKESVAAVGWLGKPLVPPTAINPPGPPRMTVRVRPMRVDEAGEEIRS